MFAILLQSCGDAKDVVYYQNYENNKVISSTNSYEIKIKPDDLLLIVVSAEDPEIAMPFNLTTISVPNPNNLNSIGGQESLQSYLVDQKGMIDFPVLGKLHVGDMTRTEVTGMLYEKISKYIKNPIINMRITNFKVSVQGEVTNPGTFDIKTERVTLPEILSMANDLTIYGKRNNILVIREVNGVKTFNRVDITQSDFVNSPFYYLSQNDVVYVEPNQTKVNGTKVGPNTGVIISITSLLITVMTLIVTSVNK
ncbi:polysaccharide biosynthesis/export family protein [Flavobacterium sp. WC2509]|uniref:polysaccharide biosynthesis/export family protein n=1 Tax=Flavobacterium sp. WC2509 TaxID=3461406 RepID=UPI0040448CA7